MKLLIGLFFLCMPPAILCGKALSKAVPCIKADAVARPESNVHYNARTTARTTTTTRPTTTTTTAPVPPDGTGPINYQPEGMLSKIFDCLDSVALSNSQQVCRKWKNIIESESWRKQVGPVNGQMILGSVPLRWEDYKRIHEMMKSKKNIWINYYRHRRNDGLQPQNWRIVNPKRNLNYIYGSSRYSDSYVAYRGKPSNEVLDLVQAGLPAAYLDLQPRLEAKEWHLFEMLTEPLPATAVAELLHENGSILDTHRGSLIFTTVGPMINKLVHYVFEKYGSGLRRIRFQCAENPPVRYASLLYVVRG